MKIFSVLLTAFAGCLCVADVLAQDMPAMPAPTVAHHWLKQFAGKWNVESEGTMAPDQPPIKATGTVNSRMIGDFWVLNEQIGNVMGTTMTGIQTIGYDEASGKYVGTWVDSMNSHMWKYSGWLDESGKKLILEAEGPNFLDGDGGTTKYRDMYEFKSADHIVATSTMQNTKGEWVTFMQGDLRRSTEK